MFSLPNADSAKEIIATDPHFLRWLFGLAVNSILNEGIKASDQRVMLSFTDWAIDHAEEVMLELGIAEKCGFNKNGWMQLALTSPGASLPTNSKVSITASLAGL